MVLIFLLLPLYAVTPSFGDRHNKNKLFPEYGINFRYIGEIKNGLDRVSVVTSVPLPRFRDIHINPLKFHNCSMDLDLDSAISKEHRRLQIAVSEWCAKATPYMQHLRKKEKYFVDRLYGLLENDLYSVLPQLRRGSNSIRSRRGLGTLAVSAVTGLITLAVESLGSYLRNKQEKRINDAVLAMREDNTAVQNTLQQYSNDFLMYGRYNVESLEKVIQTVNSLHQRQTQLEEVFAKTQSGRIDEVIDAISFNFDLHLYMKLVEEEHVNQYQLLEKASRDLLKGITTLGQGKLPRELVSDTRLRSMLKEVRSMIRKQFPDYELADNSILHYRDMKLVTFSIDRESHSLIISFPVFVKDFHQPPLKLYEVDTVAVPVPDRNRKADSYTKVCIHKPYLAAGEDYYIQLKMTELVMCKSIRYTYYCEELFVVKHKSRHSCASAIFYELGPAEVVNKCHFDYIYNASMPPTVLDGGRSLLLANFHGPRSLQCNSKNGGLPKPAPEHVYAVVDRHFLCDCQLDLERHATILRQLSSCTDNRTSSFRVEFVINLGFYELLRKRRPKLVENIRPNAKGRTQTFDVRLAPADETLLGEPTDLKDALARVGQHGRLRPIVDTPLTRPPPVLARHTSHVLSIIATVLSIGLFALVGLFLLRHFKLWTLVAGLTLASAPKVVDARQHPPMTVVCSNPYLTILATLVTIIATGIWICSHCRNLTWLRGYKYSRACTLYIFLYNSHFYVPLKIKRLTGHMHMYRIENPIAPEKLSFHRNCLWDSYVVNWGSMKLFVNGVPVQLPLSLTVPLRDKIKTRRMMTKDELDLQFMIKQGANWYNLTDKRTSPMLTA